MTDYQRSVERLQGLLSGTWSAADSAAMVPRVKLALERRRQRRTGAGIVVAGTLAGWLLAMSVAGMTGGPRERVVVPTRVPDAAVVEPPRVASEAGILAEAGIVSEPVDGSEVRVVAAGPRRARIELVRGSARFASAEGAAQPVAVEIAAGPVSMSVTALSWSFAVARHPAEVEIVVFHGTLLVRDGSRSVEVTSGETRRFPLARAKRPAEPVRDVLPAEMQERVPERAAEAESEPASEASEPASEAASEPAAEAATAPEPAADPTPELLREADRLRRARRPREAAALLRSSLDSVTAGQGAVVAFTLGRILLEDLRQPAGAADAFARARQLAGSGALAEDALAREVSAWRRAGQRQRARQRAEEYVRTYPHGYRIDAVRREGGLD